MGHAHLHLHEKRQNGPTIVHYVYQTAAPTFDGPIGGYSTVNPPQTTSSPDTSNTQTDGSNTDNTNNNNNNNNNNSNNDSGSNSNSNNSGSSNSDTQQQDANAAAAAASSSSSQAAAEAAASSSSSEAAAVAAAATTAATTPTTLDHTTATQNAPKQTATNTSKKAATSATGANTQNTAPSSSTVGSANPAASSSTPSSSSAASAPTSAPSTGGLTPGGRAGLAIGVLLIIGLLAGLVLVLLRRRKAKSNASYQQTTNEKAPYTGGLARAGSTVSTRTTATAPRLSLRPVTQFSPDLAARAQAANHSGAGLAAGTAAAAAVYADRGHAPENPFGTHAEISPHPPRLSDESGLPIQSNIPEHAPDDPFGNHAEVAPPVTAGLPASMPGLPADAPAPLRVRTPSPDESAALAAGVGGVAGGAAAAAYAAGRSEGRPQGPPAHDTASKRSVSPVTSEFSQTPGSPGLMAGGPPPSNVHRIQLDFKPSMDDELGLRAGQLVRLLHEYDDGWALCIRLDRSQQGVAPRTCLSARPVKPRPPPGARGPPIRGPPPSGMMGPGPARPSSPAGARGPPSSPYSRPPPRSMPPGPNGSQPRSMSPGPYGGGPQRPANHERKRRSNSASDVRDRRNSPPGPSPMNPNMPRPQMSQPAFGGPDGHFDRSPTPSMTRKPVPGQAM